MDGGLVSVRRFHAEGLKRFVAYVESAGNAGEPPIDLLFDPLFAEPLEFDLLLGRRVFALKFDLGMEICAAAGSEGVSKLLNDVMVWPWLSLFFSDSTMPLRNAKRFIGNRTRHIIGDPLVAWADYDHAHRHLVRSAVLSVSQFNEKARVLMGRPDQHTKLEEQLLSRKRGFNFAYSPTLVDVIYRLYWDSRAMRARRGAKSTGPGSGVRLMAVLGQFDVTFDLNSLTADQILDLLPQQEFARQ